MPLSSALPGRTDIEKRLLTELADELAAFIAGADWEQRLPFAVSRSFVLERLGNPVLFTMRLYQYVSKRTGQEEIKLSFDINIQGTGQEKWSSANGGFFLSHGTAAQVAAAIAAFKADIRPVQEQLVTHYRGTFYNS